MSLLTETTLVTAFFLGFFGSVHCVPMCGGIVGILTQASGQTKTGAQLNTAIFYNLGRISSYTLMGLLVGSIGQLLFASFDQHRVMPIAHYVSVGFMIAFGFYLLGWHNLLAVLEKAGNRLWKRIEPLGRKLLPISTPFMAFRFGMVWGWLPCGLVYSTLAWALASGSILQGGLLMLSFGAGTLPMLLALGLASGKLGALQRSAISRRLAGSLIIAFAIYQLMNPMDHSAHGSNGSHGAHSGHSMQSDHSMHSDQPISADQQQSPKPSMDHSHHH